jgi:hypothetical protein
MKTAEILRNILNLLDAEEVEAAQQPVVVNINNGATADAEQPTEQPVDDNLGIMVPPLQQKIELMKKSAGVTSAYDEDPEEDELAILKRQAGIVALTDEDEPLEG